MMYLSRGIVCRGPNKRRLYVRHFGAPIELTETEAQIWLDGRPGFACLKSVGELCVLRRLEKRGLVYCEPEHTESARYMILCRCVICTTRTISLLPRSKLEKYILVWLKKAGFHLGIAELISLFEKGIEPCRELLHSENRLVLSRLIYPCTVMIANAFENRMMYSSARRQTVDAVMKLLRRKQVFMM